MSLFNYIAKDVEGKVVRATFEAPTRHQALSALKMDGLVVVDIYDTDATAHVAETVRTKRNLRPGRLTRVSRLDLALFCRQLSISVNAGLPIREALEAIHLDLEHSMLRRILGDVIRDLHQGDQFSTSLNRQQRVFGPLFVALIRAAEESGSMPQTLEQLATYLERSERLARKIRSILAYPLFVIGFFFVICVIMTVFVLPQFEEAFAEFEARLPALTQHVLDTNRFILDHLLELCLGTVAVVVLVVAFVRTPFGRFQRDRLLLKLPFFGPIISKYNIARMSRTLGIMLRGGVAVTTAMEVSADVSSNRVIRGGLLRARDRVVRGQNISNSLGEEAAYPRLVVRMIAVGESSGQLPQVLEKVADGYEDQVEGSITVATSLFEPMAICVLGGFVLLLVMAIYMPIFTVARAVQ